MRCIRLVWIPIFLLGIFLGACAPLSSPTGASLPQAQDPATLTDRDSTSPQQQQPTEGTPFQGPLSVIITSPEDNAVITASPVQIEGEADPGTVITLNDAIVVVDSTRKFTVLLPLEPGINSIEIVASNEQGDQDFRFLTLSLE